AGRRPDRFAPAPGAAARRPPRGAERGSRREAVGAALLGHGMGWKVGIAGSQRWALQGLAQALQRSTVPEFEPMVLGAEDLRRLPPLDVLVLVPAEGQAVSTFAAGLPSDLPLLWVGEGDDAQRRGPTGRIAADASDEMLAAAVHAVASGLHVHDGAHGLPLRARPGSELSEPLTPRELEVLELMAK